MLDSINRGLGIPDLSPIDAVLLPLTSRIAVDLAKPPVGYSRQVVEQMASGYPQNATQQYIDGKPVSPLAWLGSRKFVAYGSPNSSGEKTYVVTLAGCRHLVERLGEWFRGRPLSTAMAEFLSGHAAAAGLLKDLFAALADDERYRGDYGRLTAEAAEARARKFLAATWSLNGLEPPAGESSWLIAPLLNAILVGGTCRDENGQSRNVVMPPGIGIAGHAEFLSTLRQSTSLEPFEAVRIPQESDWRPIHGVLWPLARQLAMMWACQSTKSESAPAWDLLCRHVDPDAAFPTCWESVLLHPCDGSNLAESYGTYGSPQINRHEPDDSDVADEEGDDPLVVPDFSKHPGRMLVICGVYWAAVAHILTHFRQWVPISSITPLVELWQGGVVLPRESFPFRGNTERMIAMAMSAESAGVDTTKSVYNLRAIASHLNRHYGRNRLWLRSAKRDVLAAAGEVVMRRYGWTERCTWQEALDDDPTCLESTLWNEQSAPTYCVRLTQRGRTAIEHLHGDRDSILSLLRVPANELVSHTTQRKVLPNRSLIWSDPLSNAPQALLVPTTGADYPFVIHALLSEVTQHGTILSALPQGIHSLVQSHFSPTSAIGNSLDRHLLVTPGSLASIGETPEELDAYFE